MEAATNQQKTKIANTVGKYVPGCRKADFFQLNGNDYFFSVAYLDGEGRNIANLHLIVYFENGNPVYFLVERVIAGTEAIRMTPKQISRYIEKNEVLVIGENWFSGKRISNFKIEDLSSHAEKQPALSEAIIDSVSIDKQTQVGSIVENAKLLMTSKGEICDYWDKKGNKDIAKQYQELTLEKAVVQDISEKCRLILKYKNVAVKPYQDGFIVYVGNDNQDKKACSLRVIKEETRNGLAVAVQQMIFRDGGVMYRNLSCTIGEVAELFA